MTDLIPRDAALSLPHRLSPSLDRRKEMTDILKIDEKWSVQFDPDNNDRPIYWLRHEDRHSPFDDNNAVTSMFYALLEARADLAAVPAQEQPDPRDEVIARLVEALVDTSAILQAAMVAGRVKGADQYRIGGVYLQNVSDTLDAADAALAAAKAVQP